MNKIFMIFGLLGASAAAYAQTGILKGRILNADGAPAAQVTLRLDHHNEEISTDEQGRFTMEADAGKHKLYVHAVGAQSRSVEFTISDEQTLMLDDIQLKKGNTDLDEVVIGANRQSYTADKTSNSLKLQTPLLEIPQNIQVVTGKVLADQQVTSMSDGVLRNVSGANRQEHWGDLYTNITMRGSQIQAFRNGFNVVNSFWGPLTEDLSMVDHIEFVKGPAGFMLANGDPSGLYNVVTKKPTGETKGEASLMMGSYDFYRASLDLDGKLSKDGKLLFRLNLAGQKKGSFRPNEFNDRYTVAPVISYQISDRTRLTAEYTYQRANMTDVGSYYVFSTEGYATLPRNFTAVPPGLAPTNINDHSLYLTLNHRLSDDWKLTVQAAYFNYNQTGSSMWPADVLPGGKMIRSVGIWDAKSQMTLGQAFLNGKVQTGAVTHRILAGLDVGTKNYLADWSRSYPLDSAGAPFDTKNPVYGVPDLGYPKFDRTLSLDQRATAGGGIIDQHYTGIYVQDELGFFNDRLRLTLAARYTTVTQSAYGAAGESANRFTPRAGLSYSIDRNTAVYALYDQAFVPQSGILVGGKAASPITGSNIEAGVKRDWFDGKWNTTLSVYRIMKDHEITGIPNSQFSMEIGQKLAQGVEFDLRGTIFPGFSVIANYAYTDAKVNKVNAGVGESIAYEGQRVAGSNRHTVNTWLSYKVQSGVLEGLGISGGFTWLGDRATGSYSKTEPEQNLPDYFKLDGGLFYEAGKIRLTLNVFNILDTYLYSGAYYSNYFSNPAYSWQAEAGRNWRLGVSYRF
ncbi:TonB-dependent siderophore receptor [Taibaiella koreensis]|uniref:TonB-dependent siderophore receptor n=1 Tax=Taibaiella koreensis TaxID=1268548 RepID=UPI000E5A0EB1|nr:TonB-dependent siderophore receptor [Taibaiella koreensis]